MPALSTFPVDKLARLVGTPDGPAIIDVPTAADFAADSRLLPGAVRRPWAEVASRAGDYRGRPVVAGGASAAGIALYLVGVRA